MSYTFDQTVLSSIHGISMSGSGCGPCSLASIVYNLDKSITPYKVAEYLYSIGVFSSLGTSRAGMTKAIQHYGLKSTYYTPEHSGGTVWNNAMNQIKNLAKAEKDFWVILLVVGTKNGGRDNYWTSGGHFISVTDYNNNGKLYVRDSGARKRTGYHDPSELQYDTNCIWVIERKEEPKQLYDGTFPILTLYEGYNSEKQVKRIKLFLNWYDEKNNLKVNGVYDEETTKAVKAFQKAEGLTVNGKFGSKTLAKAKTVKR